MKLIVQEHQGKELTGHEMYAAVEECWPDLGPYLRLPFRAWFDAVRSVPYVSDDEVFPGRVVEVVSRPAYLLDPALFPRLDCKKKAILIGAWARGNQLPYRFVAVSHRPNKAVHHVMPQIDFGRGWVNVDATFPDFEIGQGQPITFAAELKK